MHRLNGFGIPIEGGWIGLEAKTPAGRLSEAQKVLADMGATVVVRSIEEAFAAVGETMESGGGEKRPGGGLAVLVERYEGSGGEGAGE